VGEIADAIRRARGAKPLLEAPEPAVAGAPSLRGFQPAPAPAATPAAAAPARGTPHGHSVDSVSPRNDALVIEEDGANAEVCRHLALRLRAALDARKARSVAIVSAERADGKTTVATNLAIAFASLARSREVALVDFDLRKPSIGQYLNLARHTGIEEVLQGRADLESAAINIQHPAIDVFPVVTQQRSAHEIFVLPRVGELVQELERRYQIVVIDTPPAPIVPDASLILRHASACVPVVRTGKTRARSLRKLLDCLPPEKIVGWILNCERTSSFEYGEYYYGDPEPEPRERGARS
jgi:capsular exopolysaccharide synthesis family protein